MNYTKTKVIQRFEQVAELAMGRLLSVYGGIRASIPPQIINHLHTARGSAIEIFIQNTFQIVK